MRRLKITLLFSVLIVIVVPNDVFALFKRAKVTLVVVDEQGLPLEGIDAGVGFERNTGWGTDATAKRGLTDAEGKFTATGSCNGHIGYGAKSKGYYRSHYDYDFKDLGSFGWKPWNPELKIVMRKIENPVPMYARDAKVSNLTIPVVGKEVGFDLIAFDWVPPYGNGEHADFVFFHEKRITSWRDYDATVRVSFSNPGDGFIKIKEDLQNGSDFKLPRIAPETGYLKEISIEQSNRPRKAWVKGFEKDDNYIFRIRTNKVDGKVEEGIYGKILGPIEIGPTKDPTGVYFKYYINPDGTRNLEFDPRRNLFTDLADMEKVGIK